ncbi:type VI secretion system Vgr family protein [Pseudomonas fontis]|uniref:type VI secretion system Vgr family protein n=1 Tax=Pseudomonas fontis TaxID=2942633 RepID=UPI002361BEBA|nr:type VI secretion system tip protein TssI/VgrG [Pseudomonas fontis]MDD0974699.1 type VI secretion system tip protein VgrG [Pseudomonas fontis]
MSRQSDLRYTFKPLVGDATFEVVSFELNEGLSRPFTLSVELSSDEPDVDFGQLLDCPVLLTIWRGERPVRYVHGLVSSFTQGDTGFHRTRYHALIEPQLARARLRSNWRIFQHKSVPQIFEILLKAQHLTNLELVVCFDHQVREYCVQAGETDLAFIERLAAEEGFIYAFEHTAKGHQLILTDRLLALGLITRSVIKPDPEDQDYEPEDEGGDPLAVLYNPVPGGDHPEPALHHFRYSEQVRSARQVQRDYSFKHPAYRQEHSATARDLQHQSHDYERFDFPGRYKRDEVGKPFTQTRMAALRHDARIAEVQGDDTRLQPGLSFNLIEHPREDLNVHWRVLRIQHIGIQHTSQEDEAVGAHQGTSYVQHAVLIPGRIEWKPESLPKPRIDGPQMATVVGPPNEQIYCDEWGRVKLSFPWDRESQSNEFSSCWVRVSQGWAGGNWGSMAIPLIGQEVIVNYENSDPDLPIITGRTYCATQPPPYELPKHRTRMTIKSQTHKGVGFNELRFEDELGHEEVFLHAQKDQNNRIGHDETTQIGRNRSEEVGHDEQTHIGNDRSERIGRDHSSSVARDQHVSITRDLREDVGNDRIEATTANHQVEVGGNSTHRINGQLHLAAGDGMQCQTTVFQLSASERLEFRSPGGSIVLDQNGITLNGLAINLHGPMTADNAGSGNSLSLALVANASTTCEESKP